MVDGVVFCPSGGQSYAQKNFKQPVCLYGWGCVSALGYQVSQDWSIGLLGRANGSLHGGEVVHANE